MMARTMPPVFHPAAFLLDHFLALRLRVFVEQFDISFRVQFLARRGILRFFSCAGNPAVTIIAAAITEIHRIIIPTSNNSHYEWMPLSAQILCEICLTSPPY
jgi:hypothetical protein